MYLFSLYTHLGTSTVGTRSLLTTLFVLVYKRHSLVPGGWMRVQILTCALSSAPKDLSIVKDMTYYFVCAWQT